jgi:hypothetical protein
VTLWLHKSVTAYLSLFLCLFLCGVMSLSLNFLSVSLCLCPISSSFPHRVAQSCSNWLCLSVSLPLCRCLSGSVSLSMSLPLYLCRCLTLTPSLYIIGLNVTIAASQDLLYISTLRTGQCACVFIRQIFVLDLPPGHFGSLSLYFLILGSVFTLFKLLIRLYFSFLFGNPNSM